MATPKIALPDLRHESTFYASIKPAGESKTHALYLILKNQVFYQFAQGFAWALLKDWIVVARIFSATKGAEYGQQFRHWLSQWLHFAAKHGTDSITE